jgi:DNA-3-methyladenine glycosylase
MPGQALPASFFSRDPVVVARALLGRRLVRVLDGQRLGGLIAETEAYAGSDDEASHAYRHTPRSAIMFGPPGRAYVYFIYGMYFCLNAVTGDYGQPGAVLIRAIRPDEGVEAMRLLRPRATDARLADGPGKLCRALGIDRSLNGTDLAAGPELFIVDGPGAPDDEVAITRRVGVRGNAVALQRPWRFVWAAGGEG